MPTTDNDPTDAFWRWFVGDERKLRSALDQALSEGDHALLDAVVASIYEWVRSIDDGLTAQVSVAPDQYILAIRSPTGNTELVQRTLAAAPTLPYWRFVDQLPETLADVIVRDEAGDELVVAYGDVTFVILPPEDGARTVLFLLAAEFDPRGERGALFHAAAGEMLDSMLGGRPPGLGGLALLPAADHPELEGRPLTELAEAWAAATGG